MIPATPTGEAVQQFEQFMALPKKNRVSAKKDIDRIFRNGRTVRGSSLFIRFINNEKEYPRFVFIVPTKHIPLAVDRNRIKRMLSEKIIRSSIMGKGYDVAIGLSKKITRERFKDLAKELNNLLLKT